MHCNSVARPIKWRIRGTASEKYTTGHQSGKTTDLAKSGSATFSGTTATVWKERADGKETLRISFFMHDENGKEVYDINTFTTAGDGAVPMEYGWWLEFAFVKDE